MVNDVKMISGYAPYVDAMFIDNECAALLSEEPLKSELKFKARIFSLNSKDDFLEYLRSIERDADPKILKSVRDVYGYV